MASRLRIAVMVAALLAAALAGAQPASAQPSIVMAGGCSPTDVRPNEPAVIHCDFRVTNQGDAAVQNAVVRLGPDPAVPSLSIPQYFVLGDPPQRYMELPSTTLGVLAPGETKAAQIDVIVVAKDSFASTAYVNESLTETQLASIPGELVVRRDAEAPARELEVSLDFDEPVSWEDPNDTPEANMSITLRNRSQQPIRNIRLRDEFIATTAMRWEVTPDRQEEHAFEWDVPLLAPGEELVLQGYLAKTGPCQEAQHGAVATGTLADGRTAEAAGLGSWTHRYCECPNVFCDLPPTFTPAATIVPTRSSTPASSAPRVSPLSRDAYGGDSDGGIPAWTWAGVAGGVVLAAGAALWWRRRTAR